MVAMNPQTWDADVAEIEPGGYLFYDSTKPLPKSKFRDDINVDRRAADRDLQRHLQRPAPAPAVQEHHVHRRAVARCWTSTCRVIEKLIGEQYKGKEKLLDAEHRRRCTSAATTCASICRIRSACACSKADAVGDRIFVEGNTAAALGCVYGGATVCAWYPITPSSSLAEAFQKYCQKLRVDADSGKHRYAIVQAEDEIASIGMVVGAGWNGARAFTTTSGPGMSLMTEFIGLAYFAEIPVTIIDVQRGGPSTGMPTRTQQADVLACAYASHGDTKHVLLFPEDPHECFEFAAAALDLADRLQTPVFVMTDLDIGMNQRLCAPFAWDDARGYDRGKVMTAEELEAGKEFGALQGRRRRRHPVPHLSRHASRQGRVLHARHLARSVGALFRARAGLRLQHGAAAEEVRHRQGAGAAADRAQGRRSRRGYGVIYFGSTSPAMHEAIEALARRTASRSTRCACARSRSRTASREFIDGARAVFVVEQNRDAPDALAAGQRIRHRSRRGWCRCCTTTARRSRRASSPMRSANAWVSSARDARLGATRLPERNRHARRSDRRLQSLAPIVMAVMVRRARHAVAAGTARYG